MTVELDPFRPDRVTGVLPGRMQVFSDAGVLSAVDVHTALRLGRLSGTTDELAVLAAAFAVRAPRYGHVFAQLDDLAGTVTDEDGRAVEVDPGTWPDPLAWAAAVAASPLAGAGAGPASGVAPLHLDGMRLYLDRFWRHEHLVAAALATRAAATGVPALVVPDAGFAAVEGLFVGDPDPGDARGERRRKNAEQRDAALAALTRRLSVVAGGPGTGKTATIASIVAVALDHARRPGGQRVRVAVAAPTGKAAARLGEAMRQSAQTMPPEHVDAGVLAGVEPRTIHRLLGGTRVRGRFRHHAGNPLDVDLVVVDEVSMVPLGLLGQLLEAVPIDAAVVLVGDPDQLASVEAGTVLGDLVADAEDPASPLRGHVVTLRRGYRFQDDIKRFADAIRGGDAEVALGCMVVDPDDLEATPLALVVPDRPGEWPTGAGSLAGVRRLVTGAAQVMVEHGRRGDAAGALKAALRTKVLCAHRRGPDGVQVWNAAVEGWVHDVPAYRRPEWYAGRPVMITDNDYDLGVFNGDIGVVVAEGGSLRVVIDGRSGRPVEHRRLSGVQTVHAMTVHKSQGSQFDRVVVVLPTEPSPVLTRQLLYTAVTRARHGVTVVGSPEVLADAIRRGVTRASALPERLRSP